MRAAIQSVRTMMSLSIAWHAESWLRTLPKNSLLSLTSSVYETSMPSASMNASSVGRRDSSSSSTLMYPVLNPGGLNG